MFGDEWNSRTVYQNYYNFDKTPVKLFPNITSMPFDYLLSIVGDKLRLQSWAFDILTLKFRAKTKN